MTSIKKLLFVLLLFTSYTCFGQLEKGNFTVGGVSSFILDKVNPDDIDQKYIIISVAPNLSYFFMDGLAFSLKSKYEYFNLKPRGRKHNKYSFGGSLRYYIIFAKWAVFPELTYTKDYTIEKANSATRKINGNSRSYSLGVIYFISKRVGIEGLLTYEDKILNQDIYRKGDFKLKTMFFNIGFQVTLN